MEIARGYPIEEHRKMEHLQIGSSIGSVPDNLLVIKLPNSQVLRIVSRSLFLAMVIVTLPCIGSILREFSESPNYNLSEAADGFVSDLIDVELLDLDSLLLDLDNEGLVKKGDKAFFVCSAMGSVIDNSRFLNANEIDWVFGLDLEQKMLLNDASFEFVFGFGFEDIEFLDRILKVGGILITQLGDLPSALQKQSNYKVAYLRRFSSTIVGTRKTSLSTVLIGSSAKRKLSELKLEAKKAAFNGLEDILLEPPRKPNANIEKFNYLPDLLGDTLEDYPRRVFIDVSTYEEKEKVLRWFHEKYPTRNKKFETYTIEMVDGVSTSLDVSDWLMKNVKEDEFVVMKAEAEVVEEMLRRKSIRLVDELFLECENHWQNQEGKEKKKNNNKRAYWECLALYGKLRDNGVAVHQWWGRGLRKTKN